jgi:hypothetical protein
MSVEDLQAAEQQQGHTDNADPMGQSDHGGVPIYDLGAFRAVGHSGAQLRQLGYAFSLSPFIAATGALGSAGSRSCEGCNYSSIPRFERKGYISLMAPCAIGVDWSGVSVFVP